LPEDSNIYDLIPSFSANNLHGVNQESSSSGDHSENIVGGIEHGPGQLNDYLTDEEQGIHECLIFLPLHQTSRS